MIGKIALVAAGFVAVPLAIALGLIASQRPIEMAGKGGSDFSRQVVRKGDPVPVEKVVMSDGFGLSVRHVGQGGDKPLMAPQNGKGRYRLVAGVSHFDIVDVPETRQVIAEFLDEL